MTDDYGVLYSQVKAAVENCGGQITVPLSATRIVIGPEMTEKASHPVISCIAEFPDEASFNKFVDAISPVLRQEMEIGFAPSQPPHGGVTATFLVPREIG